MPTERRLDLGQTISTEKPHPQQKYLTALIRVGVPLDLPALDPKAKALYQLYKYSKALEVPTVKKIVNQHHVEDVDENTIEEGFEKIEDKTIRAGKYNASYEEEFIKYASRYIPEHLLSRYEIEAIGQQRGGDVILSLEEIAILGYLRMHRGDLIPESIREKRAQLSALVSEYPVAHAIYNNEDNRLIFHSSDHQLRLEV